MFIYVFSIQVTSFTYLRKRFFWEKSEAGVGRTQYKLLLICGLAFCSDAAEVGHDGPCLVY